MGVFTTPVIGLYEKAMPEALDWPHKLLTARDAGYAFVEMSIDETDTRLARLDWSEADMKVFREAVIETGVPVPSICLSGHRRYPMGSEDVSERRIAMDMMRKAVELASKLGIRTIQLAGYDVYYSPGNVRTRANFLDGLKQAALWAGESQVMLSMEIMDHPLMNSVRHYLEYARKVASPWFSVYPDIGNLSAWGACLDEELSLAGGRITAIHLKDTLAVSGVSPGQFKNVPFGEGCVDFPYVFSILAGLEYRGPFVIEMWSGEDSGYVMEIGRVREWMLEQMKQGG